jgi:hypothetical protein
MMRLSARNSLIAELMKPGTEKSRRGNDLLVIIIMNGLKRARDVEVS